MRTKLIIPWAASEALINYEREFVPSDVDVEGLDEGVLAGNSSDPTDSLPYTIDAIQDAERQGYDAVIISCFGDDGVEETRRLVDIPVLGPFKVALHVAAMLGHRICVLAPDLDRLRLPIWNNTVAYGFQERVVIRGTRASVPQALQAYQDYKATSEIGSFISEMVNTCAESIEHDDTDVVVLGCGSIKWLKPLLESELQRRGYDITVIDPLSVSIEMACALSKLKTAHSRRAYPRG